MKGKPFWRIGLALGAGVIVTDRLLHLFPDWLAKILFVIAWVLIIAGMWKERKCKQ
jgi:hypothetical protein